MWKIWEAWEEGQIRTGLLLRQECLVVLVELFLGRLGLLVVDGVGTVCCAGQSL